MRLVAKNGPLAGTALTLTDGAVVAGPGAASPGQQRWLRVRTNGNGGFVLQALDRRTPVFVNGLPLTTRPIEPRDELRVGDSLFIVHADDPAPASGLASCPVRRESLRESRGLFEVVFDEMRSEERRVGKECR